MVVAKIEENQEYRESQHEVDMIFSNVYDMMYQLIIQKRETLGNIHVDCFPVNCL